MLRKREKKTEQSKLVNCSINHMAIFNLKIQTFDHIEVVCKTVAVIVIFFTAIFINTVVIAIIRSSIGMSIFDTSLEPAFCRMIENSCIFLNKNL